MLTPTIKTHRTGLVAAAILLTLGGGFIARTAFAKIANNTIDPVAHVTDNGRRILLTGPIGCTAGERASLRVTVTQRSTGAVAEGRAFVTCTGDVQQWEVRATTRGEPSFEEGPAQAVALGRTTEGGVTTDAHQWLVEITLVKE